MRTLVTQTPAMIGQEVTVQGWVDGAAQSLKPRLDALQAQLR